MAEGRKVLIMAGGTGGHVFPALATADELRAQGVAVEWLGTAAGIEADVVPKADIKLHCIAVQGLRGKGRLSLLLAPFKLLQALLQALAVLRRVKPDAVLGMGGFASGPGGLAAWLTGTPLVIHEQNAIAGMTNSVLARIAKRVLQAFPRAFKGQDKGEIVGNPVRGPILELPAPELRFAGRSGAMRLLVVGGSLGAKAINEVIPQALAQLPQAQRPQVWHQTGKRNIEETRALYELLGVEARVVPFIERMDEAYGWADLVLCRAGALTVSELAIAGVASVLVPFPFAVDDHQTANAEFLARLQAAERVPQHELTPERVLRLLARYGERDRLLQMACAARAEGRPEAGKRVAAICLEVMK